MSVSSPRRITPSPPLPFSCMSANTHTLEHLSPLLLSLSILGEFGGIHRPSFFYRLRSECLPDSVFFAFIFDVFPFLLLLFINTGSFSFVIYFRTMNVDTHTHTHTPTYTPFRISSSLLMSLLLSLLFVVCTERRKKKRTKQLIPRVFCLCINVYFVFVQKLC